MQVKTYLSLANPTCSSVFYLLKTRRLGMVSKSHLQPLGIHSQFHLHLRQWVSSNHYWLSNVLLHLGFQIAGLGHVWAGVWYYLCSDLLLDAVGNHTNTQVVASPFCSNPDSTTRGWVTWSCAFLICQMEIRLYLLHHVIMRTLEFIF